MDDAGEATEEKIQFLKWYSVFNIEQCEGLPERIYHKAEFSTNVDFYDPDHADDEHRFLIMGESQRGRLLMVSYAESGDAVR